MVRDWGGVLLWLGFGLPGRVRVSGFALTVLFVLLPTGLTVWCIGNVERQYGIREEIQERAGFGGQLVTVGLLVVGFFAALGGTRGLLAFPLFEGG